MQKLGAKFLLHVRDKCKTSQKAMFTVLGVNHLVEAYIDIVMVCKVSNLVFVTHLLLSAFNLVLFLSQREIHRHLNPCTQSVDVATIREVAKDTLPFSEVFSQVRTKIQLDKYLVDSMNMIPPEKVYMGTELVWKKRPIVDLVDKDRFGYVIPFLPALQRLLRNPELY